MSIRDLIDAIESGNAVKIEDTFNAAMAEKVSSRLEDMKTAASKNMFNEEQSDSVAQKHQENQSGGKPHAEKKITNMTDMMKAVRTHVRKDVNAQQRVKQDTARHTNDNSGKHSN